MVARGWCTYSTNHRSTCIVDDRHTHGTAPNNYPKPTLLHFPPGPKMMNYNQGVQVKATKNPGAVIQPCPVLRRHTKMLRRSLGSPPAQRHPRQACLGPRFCLPATPFVGPRGEVELCTGWGVLCLYLWAAAKVELCLSRPLRSPPKLSPALGGAGESERWRSSSSSASLSVCLAGGWLVVGRACLCVYASVPVEWWLSTCASLLHMVRRSAGWGMWCMVYRSQRRQQMLSERVREVSE